MGEWEGYKPRKRTAGTWKWWVSKKESPFPGVHFQVPALRFLVSTSEGLCVLVGSEGNVSKQSY